MLKNPNRSKLVINGDWRSCGLLRRCTSALVSAVGLSEVMRADVTKVVPILISEPDPSPTFGGSMEHRNFPSSSRMLMDQSHDRNHSTVEQSYDHMGTGISCVWIQSLTSFLGAGRAVASENGSLAYPMENVSRSGVYSASQWNSESRVNAYPSSSFSMEVPHLQPSFPVSSYHPFPQSPAAGNIYMSPQYNAGHTHTNYNDRHNIHEDETGLLDSVTGSRRAPVKRKSPCVSVACETGSSSRFYSAGSSSSSSEIPLEKPPSDYQNIPSCHIRLSHYGGGSLPSPGEDSVRNVRSRSRLDFESTPIRTHLPSYSSRHYHSTTNLSSYHGAVDLANINSDETTQEWNFNALPCPAHGTSRNSGINNGLSHERDQFLTRGSGTETGVCHHDSASSRNLVPPLQYLHAPPVWGAREGRGSHSQRAIPSYRAALSYPRFGYEAASTENGLQSISETHSSRYSRPSTGGWQNSYRNGRSRIDIERFQSVSSIVDTHDRIGSEDLMMMDHSSLYASSRNLFDQYGDMRLDIDNMGYEVVKCHFKSPFFCKLFFLGDSILQLSSLLLWLCKELLALGERIGNVSTGVSEDMIKKCLMETKNSSAQNDEEGTCCICLEEYGNGEEVGILKKCGHKYHVSCIRKWLLVKNACPICKASALADCSPEG
ncbi:hypothetical protein RHMOL_Rhmol03G0140000 [Rhododendron molle]|uniref:Uncharacterized protein n=1 Tax=Rhododendron molle TaxID=49168 RepID=A0ACC0PF75_RHOML|nr:hypothetical protein RHMOL_Rhmol03G0140000 [Rhododendron molle]